tara:strand:- start:383 stop:565 length:183 start_codon:yes stop_codon:yes gene_type:complete
MVLVVVIYHLQREVLVEEMEDLVVVEIMVQMVQVVVVTHLLLIHLKEMMVPQDILVQLVQ